MFPPVFLLSPGEHPDARHLSRLTNNWDALRTSQPPATLQCRTLVIKSRVQ